MAQRATRVRGWLDWRRERRSDDRLARAYRRGDRPPPPIRVAPELILAASLTFFVLTMWLVSGR